jgi:transposase
VVDALQGLRGVQCTAAVTTVVELGDLSRFENPRPLMSYLGLTPSERTSRTRSHNPLSLFVISYIEHIVLRNN